jgi:hypothetical protein
VISLYTQVLDGLYDVLLILIKEFTYVYLYPQFDTIAYRHEAVPLLFCVAKDSSREIY